MTKRVQKGKDEIPVCASDSKDILSGGGDKWLSEERGEEGRTHERQADRDEEKGDSVRCLPHRGQLCLTQD